MMHKYLVVLAIVVIGIVLGISYIDNDHRLSETAKVVSQIPFKEEPLVIKQVPFTTTSGAIQPLGPLDDHGIADAFGFFETFGSYFDNGEEIPSMFSCEDAETERLKENLRGGNCQWSRVIFPPFSFVVMNGNPIVSLVDGRIAFGEGEEYRKYKHDGMTRYTANKPLKFEDIIKNSNQRLDESFCLRPYYTGDAFQHSGHAWIIGFGKNLNNLFTQNKLHLSYIHEMSEGKCSNNDFGRLIYPEGSKYFYTRIDQYGGPTSFLVHDGIYTTHTSIDLEEI
ncbi:MAG: hypothetical protein HG456_001080 [candidate division SR1 bacterium]|nr:hypothetical protein [candidate division SR1 bacterium]